MMRPVGVGLTSRGPIGVDGLTITAGSLSFATIVRPAVRRRSCFACRLRRRSCNLESDGFRRPGAIVAQGQGGDAAGIDNSLDAGAFCLLHHDARAVHVGGKILVGAGPTADNRRPREKRIGRRPWPVAPTMHRACRLEANSKSSPSSRNRGLPGRTSARTAKPSESSFLATADPTSPVAPVIRICSELPMSIVCA